MTAAVQSNYAGLMGAIGLYEHEPCATEPMMGRAHKQHVDSDARERPKCCISDTLSAFRNFTSTKLPWVSAATCKAYSHS
jgi:hypothetical protein